MSLPSSQRSQQGATLVELILSIVIVSTALAGILGLVNLTVLHSADPIIQHQAIAIAESYIEEITALPITDPDGSNAGETRATFDNVDDYNGLNDVGVRDQDGVAVANLANYTVTVAISNQTISGLTNMREILVTVSRGSMAPIRLTAFRAPYN